MVRRVKTIEWVRGAIKKFVNKTTTASSPLFLW